MHTVEASEFKTKCVALMDQVARTGEAILVTKDGKPLAELHPQSGRGISSPFGIHKGLVQVPKDLVSPLDGE